jgi:hypothetical protein
MEQPMIRFIVVLCLVGVLSTIGIAADYEVSVNTTVTSGYLYVDFYITLTGTTTPFVLHSATLLLDYPAVVLGSPLRVAANDGPWNNSEGDYFIHISKDEVLGYAGLTIENTGEGDFNGPQVTDTPTRIGTVRLAILDPSATAHLSWRGIGTTTQVLKMKNLGVDGSGIEITNVGLFLPPDDAPLPITLSSFTATSTPTQKGVLLSWTTLSEINNYGFWIQRRAAGQEAFVDLENSFTPGHGTTIQPRQYSFADVSIPISGEYEYRLRQVDLDGTDHLSNSVRVSVVLTSIAECAPIMFALDQNYPNPFNPETAIRFSVDKSGQAELTVFNTLGELIGTLYSGYAEMGRYYEVRFNAAQRPSGVYFYRLSTAARADFRRMLLLK